MDKLKENGYWIAVGAIGLVLIGLIVFLVYLPVTELSAARAEVEKTRADVEKIAKRKRKGNPDPAPFSAPYNRYLKDEKKNAEEVRDKAVAKYKEISRRFQLYFDEAETAPAPSEFSARYNVELDKLIKEYRDKFKIEVPKPAEGEEPAGDKDAKDGPPPKVDRVVDEQAFTDTSLPAIMREFWMVDAVIKACMELEVGGLKAINFPGRQAAGRESAREGHKYHALSEVDVTLEIPFSKLEDFMTKLFASDRVLFQLHDMTVKRSIESVKALAPLEVTKEYKDTIGAGKDAYPASEPPVVVDLKLAAFEIKEVVEDDAKKQEGKKSDAKKPAEETP